jgi:hypothetical protein
LGRVPAGRAIRYKSVHARTSALRAFHYYPSRIKKKNASRRTRKPFAKPLASYFIRSSLPRLVPFRPPPLSLLPLPLLSCRSNRIRSSLPRLVPRPLFVPRPFFTAAPFLPLQSHKKFSSASRPSPLFVPRPFLPCLLPPSFLFPLDCRCRSFPAAPIAAVNLPYQTQSALPPSVRLG